MSITDELRKYAQDWRETPNLMDELDAGDIDGLLGDFIAIADRIDAEHEKAIRELNNLADASVLLPVDADGVPIHLGDKVYQVKGGWVYTVKSISFYPNNTTVTFECKHGFGSDSAHNVRHYHAPTVEDVLREFALAVCKDDALTIRKGVVEEYAKRLTLAEGEDA